MVFEDPTRKRWRITLASFTALGLTGLAIFGLSAAALMTNPPLPSIQSGSNRPQHSVPSEELLKLVEKDSQDKNRFDHRGTKHDLKKLDLTNYPGFKSFKTKSQSLTTAFLLQDDPQSLKSFEANSAKLDVVFPDWYSITQASCEVSAKIQPAVTQAIRAKNVALMPRLTNGDNSRVNDAETRKILNTPALSACLAKNLAESVEKNGAQGLNVDIETLQPADDNAYLAFISNLKKELHSRGKLLVVDIPSGNTAYDASLISRMADAVLVIMHGQHYAGGKQGPISGYAWYVATLDHFRSVIPAEKLIVGLGSYGFDWNVTSGGKADGLTHDQIMALAGQAKALPAMDPTSRNMLFGYQDDRNQTHAVWFLDAPQLWNEYAAAQNKGILGIGLWRLGSEDQNVWKFLGQSEVQPAQLASAPALSNVQTSGKTELFKLGGPPQPGNLRLDFDSSGLVTGGAYTKLPSGYELVSAGSLMAEKTAIFAFVGGPDPVSTPLILDYLSKNKLPAIFFVTNRQAAKYPELIAKIRDGGYYIGSQTDPSIAHTPAGADALRNDLNATQRTIENVYKRHTLLYLSPYSGYRQPTSPDHINSFLTADSLGYLTVSPGIEIKNTGKTTADAIVAAAISGLEAGGHIMAFQDKADNATETAAALNKLGPELKARSYTFPALEGAVGLAKADLLPSVGGNEAVLVAATGVANTLRNLFWPTIFWIFALTTAFSVFRILFMSVFVLRSIRHRAPRMINPRSKRVSILIPAFNEEKTIGKTLMTLQASQHEKFEALVIDDGSTDSTPDVVKRFAARDPRIKLVRKENGGKSTALNLGMLKAKNDIVITIDADTVLMPQTIDELIKPFANPKVDAVCGNVEVGNVHNLLTGFQALEYITAQNFDRRAFDEINAISVVPGATGAWKRSRVLEIGGYQNDTLTEDADLTIRMLAAGGKIVYAPNARSQTEAPENMRDLAKQRFRWGFGTFQCLGKHSGNFFKGRVGWVALPNIFVFQILFPLLAPVGDIAMLISLWNQEFSIVFWGYVIFTTMDVIGSIFAFLLEHKPKRLMLLVLVQRFFYRQFLYITIIRAIIAMLRGQRYGWNKLKRMGTVKTVETETAEA